MRYTLAAAALAASTAFAQVSLPSILANVSQDISPQCEATILGLYNSSISQCLDVNLLIPTFLSTNTSIVPGLDAWMSTLCAGDPCSAAVLSNTSQTIISGCGMDLMKANVTNQTVEDVFELYPLAREILCLKTTEPFNATNATFPITSPPFNTTNGTFCVTNLLTEVATDLGTNLTVNFLLDLALGGNSSALQVFEHLNATDLCQDCIFAAADLIGQEYPELWMYPINSQNLTIAAFLNGTCSGKNESLTFNGTLPTTIFEAAANSTYPFNVTTGNFTYIPGNNTVPPPVLFNVTSFNVTSNYSISTNTSMPMKREVNLAKRRIGGEQ